MNLIKIYFQNKESWKKVKNIHWNGSAFYFGHSIDLSILEKTSFYNIDDFISFLRDLNGFFSIIYDSDNVLYAAVDRVRSIPLFYSIHNGDFYISDSAYWIQEKIQSKVLDIVAAAEFMLTGYVTGSDTLISKIKQLQAGETLILERCIERGLKVKTIRYYQYIPGNYSSKSEIDQLAELDQVLIRVFGRLIDYASGRTIVVPLSGGYDSRLIVLMLKRLEYKNVIAFCYGKPGNKDSEISKKVAQILGIQWIFVPYSNEDWYKWYRSKEFKDYSKRGFELSSIPHIQDWPAVWKLKKNGCIPRDSLFVPGHGGDVLSGKVTNLIANQTTDPIEAILKYNYSLWKCPSTECLDHFKRRISSSFSDKKRLQDSCGAFESWRVQERHAKFIINSVRVYEFWGYCWWTPFWDNELMDFWSKIPENLKINQKMYKNYVNILFNNVTHTNIKTTHQNRYWCNPITDIATSILKRTFVFMVAKNIYKRYRLVNAYYNNTNNFYGIIHKDKFSVMYSGDENINSFIAVDILESLYHESKNVKKVLEWAIKPRK